MAFADHVTPNISVTPRICSIDSIRSCADSDEAPPEQELCSSPASADIPFSLGIPRLEKEGVDGMMIHKLTVKLKRQ